MSTGVYKKTSNGSWCMGIKGEMSGTVCVTFTWDMYIYIWVVYRLCFFCCLFITVTWWYVWCFEWASGNQEEVQACLVTLWLFIIFCYSLYNTHRRNIPSAQLPALTALIDGSLYSLLNSPLHPGYCSAGGWVGARQSNQPIVLDSLWSHLW